MRSKIFLLVISAILFFCFSCQECEPLTSQSNNMNIAFFHIDSLNESKIDYSILPTYDSIFVKGFTENLVIDNTATSYILPLSPIKDTTIYIFAFQGFNDTLAVVYQTFTKVISPDCGLSTELINLTILKTNTTFDATIVIKGLIDFTKETNIKIYK